MIIYYCTFILFLDRRRPSPILQKRKSIVILLFRNPQQNIYVWRLITFSQEPADTFSYIIAHLTILYLYNFTSKVWRSLPTLHLHQVLVTSWNSFWGGIWNTVVKLKGCVFIKSFWKICLPGNIVARFQDSMSKPCLWQFLSSKIINKYNLTLLLWLILLNINFNAFLLWPVLFVGLPYTYVKSK